MPPGGTGAFGIVTVNGTQKLYLPQLQVNAAGNAVISVVDLGVKGNGVSGAPALITDIDLGSSDLATETSGTSNVVIAASTDNHNIWFIDPTTDTITSTIVLDMTYDSPFFSEGAGGIVNGIAMDPANNRAILSVWNGFAILDLTSRAITQTIEAAPSENFGFDAKRQRIIAPFYDCSRSTSGALPDGSVAIAPATCNDYRAPDGKTVMTDGLNIIDLKDGTVYTYEDPQATDPTHPVGTGPDSAATDPNTGVIVVPSEVGASQTVIDLSKAVFDKTKKTVTAPHHAVQNVGLTGVAVDAIHHFAFWAQEETADIALADLNALNAGDGRVIKAMMPDLPNKGGPWGNLGEPHGVAVATGIIDGHPIGVVVDGLFQWVARIDLAALWAGPRLMGSPSEQVDLIAPNDLAATLTLLDARAQRP
jgi:hypothetical protein